MVQSFKPIEAVLRKRFVQSPKICCDILVFIFLEELLAAFTFQYLAEDLYNASLVHSLYYGIHDMRSFLIESHQLERTLIAKWPNQSAKVVI